MGKRAFKDKTISICKHQNQKEFLFRKAQTKLVKFLLRKVEATCSMKPDATEVDGFTQLEN